MTTGFYKTVNASIPTETKRAGHSLWMRIFRGCLMVLGCVFLALFGWYYFATEDIRNLTTHLPTTDRIEIESVALKGETIDKVLDSKVLIGSDTKEIETLWRSQGYDCYNWSLHYNTIMCHEPGYRIRFYNHSLITEATICFKCDNIYFYKYHGTKNPDQYMEAIFNADDSAGKKLRTYLSNLFPSQGSLTDHDQ